jgi:fermentation-respiration switch protein FrsA (DUF1100 family)
VFIIHGNNTIVPPFGQYAYYEQEKSHWYGIEKLVSKCGGFRHTQAGSASDVL